MNNIKKYGLKKQIDQCNAIIENYLKYLILKIKYHNVLFHMNKNFNNCKYNLFNQNDF